MTLPLRPRALPRWLKRGWTRARDLLPRRPLAPLPADACRARISIVGDIAPLRIASTVSIPVEVTNASPRTWPDRALALSYHWHRSEGATWVAEGERTRLPRALAPGDTLRLDCAVRTPNTPAHYELELDLVHGQKWFGPSGSQTARLPVAVGGQPPDSYADIDYRQAYATADLSKDYWSVTGPGSEDEFRQLSEAKLQMLRDLGLRPESRVLDVGCGTGSLAGALEGFLASEGLYYGTELTDIAVEFCRQKFSRPNFHFVRNEMTRLPVDGQQFDFIVFFSVFTHTYPSETRELLSEAKRLLDKAGLIVADVFESDLQGEFVGTRTMVVLPRGQILGMAEDLELDARTVSQFAWDPVGPPPIDRIMRGFAKRAASVTAS